MDLSHSRREFRRAKRSIPGGVNSPVRAFGSVGGIPRFIDSAKGARVRDIDGNEYIDYVGSWGPLILGHANPTVLRKLREAMSRGTRLPKPGSRLHTFISVRLVEKRRSIVLCVTPSPRWQPEQLLCR